MSEVPIGVSILAKAPIPGFVKTRLIPLLGPVGAAELQHRFIERSVQTAVAANVGPVTVWYAPADYHGHFSGLAARYRVRLRAQVEEDLGRRMHRCIRERQSEAGELVIGTDCPCLLPAQLGLAADVLRSRKEAVVFPAEDGGYGLIGLRAADIELFRGIPWGTDQVMLRTRHKLRKVGKTWSEPVRVWDVDRPEDVFRLRRIGLGT